MLDQRDWLDLVRVLERAQAVWDVGDRRTAHFHWAAKWGFRDWKPSEDYQAWRKAAYKDFKKSMAAAMAAAGSPAAAAAQEAAKAALEAEQHDAEQPAWQPGDMVLTTPGLIQLEVEEGQAARDRSWLEKLAAAQVEQKEVQTQTPEAPTWGTEVRCTRKSCMAELKRGEVRSLERRHGISIEMPQSNCGLWACSCGLSVPRIRSELEWQLFQSSSTMHAMWENGEARRKRDGRKMKQLRVQLIGLGVTPAV